MKQGAFPEEWNEARVRRVIAHYEQQSEEKAGTEDEAAFESTTQTFIEVPNELLEGYQEMSAQGTGGPPRAMTCPSME